MLFPRRVHVVCEKLGLADPPAYLVNGLSDRLVDYAAETCADLIVNGEVSE